MKILTITNMYPSITAPFYGIFVKEQVESIRREGVFVDVEFINGKENKFDYFFTIIRLLKKLRQTQYDIIHSHHTYCVYLIVIVKKILSLQIPVILTFHEGEIHYKRGLKPKGIKRLVFSKIIKKMAIKMSDFVIAVQHELLDSIHLKGKSMTLPCGVDTDLFKPLVKNECRKRLNLPLNKKIIFFPASPQDPQKGIHILNKAIKLLNKENLLLITGGNIKHDDMPYYMNAADVIVQLSLFEASPMVLKEAMAINTPLVFTEAGDTRKIIANTNGCFLCKRNPTDVASKITEALNMNSTIDSRQRIFDIGLTLNAVAKKNIALYKNLLNNTKGRL